MIPHSAAKWNKSGAVFSRISAEFEQETTRRGEKSTQDVYEREVTLYAI